MSVIETKLFPFMLACFLFSLVVVVTTYDIVSALEFQMFWLSSYLSITVFLALYGILLSIRRTSWLLLSLSAFVLLTPSFSLILYEPAKHIVTLPMFLLLEKVHVLVGWLMALFFVDGVGRIVAANLRKVRMLRWNLWLMAIVTVVAGLHCFLFYGVGLVGLGAELPLFVISAFSLLCIATLMVFDNDYEPVALQTALYLCVLCFWVTELDVVAPLQAGSQLLMQFLVLNLFLFSLRAHEQAQVQKLVTSLRSKQRRSTEHEVNLLIDAIGHLTTLKQPYSLVVFETVFSGMLKQVLSPAQQTTAVKGALNLLDVFLREYPFIFRFKGDREGVRETRLYSKAGEGCYAVILVGEQDKEDLQYFISTMHEVISNPITVGQHSFKLHCAFSAVQYPTTQYFARRMLTVAKRGLGQAEQNIGRYFLYTGQSSSSRAVHWQLVVDLQHAIEQETIQIVHQPQIDLSNHHVIGNEALLRWHHEQFGFINPELVVKLAEENNLINALTELVISKSMTQLAVLWRRGFKERMSINVSAHDLLRTSFLPTVQHAAISTGISLDYITIELTESAAMEDFEFASKVFSELRSLGIQIAIDDFGTGYSSLSTLAHLPFNELKVDKQFVSNIATSSKNQSITQSIIDLANHLDAHVVAEGVDNIIAEQWLAKIGCQIGQGYLYSKGLCLDDYIEWRNNQQTDNSVDFCESKRKIVAK